MRSMVEGRLSQARSNGEAAEIEPSAETRPSTAVPAVPLP
jgi:hypothetical protein